MPPDRPPAATGLAQPPGKENNWVQTIPWKEWFTLLRL
jgi:hypothetical protein